jgi:TRAP transporter TAXI family solute receptor
MNNVLVAALIGAAAVCAGCGSPVTEAAPVRLRVVVGGPPPSQPHRFGTALAETVGQRAGVTLAVDGVASSVESMRMLHQGQADVGFAFGDGAYLAFMGAVEPAGERLNGVRAIAVLQPRPLHLLVPPDSDIRRVADLRQRRVAINPQDLSAPIVLEALGAPTGELRLEPFPAQGSAAAFREGLVDAIVTSTSDPSAAITTATDAGVRILPLDGPAVAVLRERYPFLRPAAIRGGTYRGHPSLVPTIGVDHLLICRASLDAAVVYEITKRLVESLPSLVALDPSFDRFEIARAAAAPIPLHSGAARYYRERELAQ